MNDKKERAVRELKNYRRRKESLENIKERLTILNEQLYSVGGQAGFEMRVQNPSGAFEDPVTAMLSEKERLSYSFKATRRLVELTERVISQLSREERRVLEAFYLDRQENHLRRLCLELAVEQAQLYRLKERALAGYIHLMYGLAGEN